jgi:hypothetical protein
LALDRQAKARAQLLLFFVNRCPVAIAVGSFALLFTFLAHGCVLF